MIIGCCAFSESSFLSTTGPLLMHAPPYTHDNSLNVRVPHLLPQEAKEEAAAVYEAVFLHPCTLGRQYIYFTWGAFAPSSVEYSGMAGREILLIAAHIPRQR